MDVVPCNVWLANFWAREESIEESLQKTRGPRVGLRFDLTFLTNPEELSSKEQLLSIYAQAFAHGWLVCCVH